MSGVISPVAIIPVYNHPHTLRAVVDACLSQKLPVVIVDDGSNEETKLAIRALESQQTTVLTHPLNLGKGGAMKTGFEWAAQQGYTHALQIDADGQHDVTSIATLLEAMHQYPESLILGAPQYDESVPKSRLQGRKISNFWVSLNTLSHDFEDALCGFRIYPLTATLQSYHKSYIGSRMDFDPEILIALLWEGLSVVNVPVKVIYPKDGISHFNVYQDNVRLSLMYAKRFIGMLFRSPLLLLRKLK